MADEIAFENGWISNFEGLVTLTLTLDRLILHTVVHAKLHWNRRNFLWLDGQTHLHTYTWTDGRTDICQILSDFQNFFHWLI